jgi:hypothetical protein
MALVVAHGAQADPWQLARARVGMVLPMGNMLFCERQFKGNAFFLLGFPSNLKPLEPLWNMAERVGFEPTVAVTLRLISNQVP